MTLQDKIQFINNIYVKQLEDVQYRTVIINTERKELTMTSVKYYKYVEGSREMLLIRNKGIYWITKSIQRDFDFTVL